MIMVICRPIYPNKMFKKCSPLYALHPVIKAFPNMVRRMVAFLIPAISVDYDDHVKSTGF